MAIKEIRKKLAEDKIDGLLISSSYNIGYLTGFFGFSKTEREGYLLLTAENIYIFASGLNIEAVRKHLDAYSSSEDRRDESRSSRQTRTVQTVEISPRAPLTKKVLADIIKKEKIKKLGFEKHNLLFAEYEKLKTDLPIGLIALQHVIEEMRMIKTHDEIAAIERACALGDSAFTYILKKIKTGITEKELAFDLEVFIRKKGAELSFPTIIAFGENAAIPHHVASNKSLEQRAQFILLDFGVKVDEYCSDMTRTVFFGKASKEQKRMYETVLEAQQKAFEFLQSSFRSGMGGEESPLQSKGTPPAGGEILKQVQDDTRIKASEVDGIARDYITSHEFPTIPHSLGHGIGLEVHEPPRLTIKSEDVLKPNMVFSIEPGIYLPETGGVRIEDLVVLESWGPRWLTKSKRELIEI